jgi:predicted nucleic acid-binding protein
MNALYVETSAVLGWLFGEPTAAEVARAIDAAEVVVTSALTFVEVERAIHRAVSQHVVKESDAHKLRGVLARERSQWITMVLTDDVLARAGRAFPVEPVRTLDAIHLATALAFVEALPDLKMLATDRRVLDNATSLGLALS